jgi:hypothetical protein
MDSLENELRDWLSRTPQSLRRLDRSAGIEHIGTVTRVGASRRRGLANCCSSKTAPAA